MSIKYTDGDSVESEILSLVRAASSLDCATQVGKIRYDEWAVRYHLCPQRANLVRHLNFSGLKVLELGAGMGAVSRFLAETSAHLTCLEGTENRLAVLRERLRDLTNWTGVMKNIQDAEFTEKFDVVCVVGVMEYAELFVTPEKGGTAFTAFLKKAKSFLKEDGVLVLAIENQLGLKYWSGASEDHSARLFDGICGYPAKNTAKTFSKKQLLKLMASQGFETVDTYYPFPDYKIPASVLSGSIIESEPELSADLATHELFEDYSSSRLKYFPEYLAAQTVAKAGLLSEFANSFLFVGSPKKSSKTRKKLLENQIAKNEIAWHYALSRNTPTRTAFVQKTRGEISSITVVKEPLVKTANVAPVVGKIATWTPLPSQALLPGSKVRAIFTRSSYFEEWDNFSATLTSFLKWSFAKWATTDTAMVKGEALDAIFLNAVTSGDAEFALFDLEWSLNSPMPKSWFVFRNIYGLVRDFDLISSAAPFRCLEELYVKTCGDFGLKPNLEEDMAREAKLQAEATGVSDEAKFIQVLRDCFSVPAGARYPKLAGTELKLREEIVGLRIQNRHLMEKLGTLTHKAADRLNASLKKIPGVHGTLKKVLSSVSNYAKAH